MFLGNHKIQKGVFKLGGESGRWLPPHISKSFHVLSECPLLVDKFRFNSRLHHGLGFWGSFAVTVRTNKAAERAEGAGVPEPFRWVARAGDHFQPSVFEVIWEGTPLLALEGDQ